MLQYSYRPGAPPLRRTRTGIDQTWSPYAAIVDRNWGLLGHGMVNTRFVYGLSEAEERAYYIEMREHVERLTGIGLKGMGGPGPQAATESTPDVLAEAGYLYHGDWFHDEQPFPLRTRAGRMISMPYSTEINDAPFLGVGFEADDFLEAIKRQFDRLYADGADNGRVMCISLHSHLMGQPQRIRYLDEALRYILSHEGVWQATGDEIAEHYMQYHYDATVQWLGRAQ